MILLLHILIIIPVSLVAGSFANNVLSFYINGSAFDIYRSRCSCGKHYLSFYELVPVYSYARLKGRCSRCNENLSLRYLLIEILFLLIGIISYMLEGWTLNTLTMFVFLTTAALVAVIDGKKFIIPNYLLGVFLTIAFARYAVNIENLLLNSCAAMVITALLIICKYYYAKFKNKNIIGAGDIKLIFILFLIVDFPVSLIGLWVASIVALIAVTVKGKMRAKIPFGLYLSLSYSLIYVLTNGLIFNKVQEILN